MYMQTKARGEATKLAKLTITQSPAKIAGKLGVERDDANFMLALLNGSGRAGLATLRGTSTLQANTMVCSRTQRFETVAGPLRRDLKAALISARYRQSRAPLCRASFEARAA